MKAKQIVEKLLRESDQLPGKFNIDSEKAKLLVSIAVGNSGLNVIFSGTYAGKEVKGHCYCGMETPDSNVLQIEELTVDGRDFRNSNEETDGFVADDIVEIIDSAPEMEDWAEYAMEQTRKD